MNKYKTVVEYISNSGDAEEALILLREIVLSTGLIETVKWGAPVYTFQNKNIVGLGAFKLYTGLWFYQGALLKDPKKKLMNAQEGVTKAMRQWRFESLDEIEKEAEIILNYIGEAITNQKEGKAIKASKGRPLVIPPELQELLDGDQVLQQSFNQFNLTRKREFTDYISQAKRAETKSKRLEKIKPMILEGIGLGDKYRK